MRIRFLFYRKLCRNPSMQRVYVKFIAKYFFQFVRLASKVSAKVIGDIINKHFPSFEMKVFIVCC